MKTTTKLSVLDHKYGSTKEFTIGIEEEFQIIDSRSYALVSAAEELFSYASEELKKRLQHELIQAEIEINTDICENISQAREDIISMRNRVIELAKQRGYFLGSTGTHPFSRWQDQKITEMPYYQRLVNELQWLARQNNSFGQHVHIGVGDPEKAIQVINALRSYLPHLLALSTNSPFWQGEFTGLKSTRAQIFNRSFLRKGIPPIFKNWAEYIEFEDTLRKTGCIHERGEIWWDVRPHRDYGTIEVRICDVQMRVDECITLAALVQALIYKLSQYFEEGRTMLKESKELIDENKWRALRHGIQGTFIDISTKSEIPAKDAIKQLIDFVGEAAQQLGSAKELSYIEKWLSTEGSGADRQLEIYKKTRSLKDVMSYVVKESFESL